MLQDASAGSQEALAALLPVVYDELRRLAGHYLRRERPDHTLQPTALVHEAYLRLIDQQSVQWENRAHFFAIAAQSMRRILVDHARGRQASKRGGVRSKVTLDERLAIVEERSVDLLALDTALGRLAEVDPEQARIVELRYFGGLTVEETGTVLGISPATVKRDWSMAKAWLHRELQPSRSESEPRKPE